MRAGNIVAVIATVPTLFISAAQAQSIPPLLEQPPNKSACAPYGADGALRANETTGNRSLSDQLAASKGVICPPVGVDPASRHRQSAAAACR